MPGTAACDPGLRKPARQREGAPRYHVPGQQLTALAAAEDLLQILSVGGGERQSSAHM
jgi:hypothetical protein